MLSKTASDNQRFFKEKITRVQDTSGQCGIARCILRHSPEDYTCDDWFEEVIENMEIEEQEKLPAFD